MVTMPLCDSAAAFRPFDGTDAAVAREGEFEIELEPGGYRRDGEGRVLVAPAAVLNYGIAKNWEAVIEGEVVHGLSDTTPAHGLVGTGAFLKGVLREGSLQDRTGPSVATEFGVLLPEVHGAHSAGASLAVIASQRFAALTVHLNVAGALTREQHGDVFTSVIAEGPRDWRVRPVVEILRDQDFGNGTTTSGLLGAIWQVSNGLAFDSAMRRGRAEGHRLDEIRAGLTFSF